MTDFGIVTIPTQYSLQPAGFCQESSQLVSGSGGM
jgi:hypothetical protein